jgi:hypothetical protein
VNIYELGLLTTTITSASCAAEIVGGTRPISILEIGTFNNAATASTFALGRPGNTPAGGTATTATKPSHLPTGGVVSSGGVILSGWSTAPTAPAAGNTLRQIGLPNLVAAGVVWTWNVGELMVGTGRADSVVLWNLAAGSAQRFYVKFAE